jgi:hypothetical protein
MRAFPKVVPFVLFILATTLMLSPGSAQPLRRGTVVSGQCQTTAQNFVAATNRVKSEINGVVSLLPDRVTFVQGRTGCVLVTFSSEIQAPGGLQVRPLLDGNPTSVPSTAILTTMGQNYETHSMSYVFTEIPPGRHQLRFEIATGLAGLPAYLQMRTTILSYTR